jgi:putative membrane protein
MSSSKSHTWIVYLMLGAVLGSLIILFAYQNSDDVLVKFLIWEFEAPLSLTYAVIIGISFLILILLGMGSWFRRRRLTTRIKKLENRLNELEEENKELKSSNTFVVEEEPQEAEDDDIEIG